ncbi:MAG: hypothetical protein WCJ07_00095, partial [Verrucomicrobiota bacterium]
LGTKRIVEMDMGINDWDTSHLRHCRNQGIACQSVIQSAMESRPGYGDSAQEFTARYFLIHDDM